MARNLAGVELALTCDNADNDVVLPLQLKAQPTEASNGSDSKA